jgi:O-succinylbenzoic acid--CoA ligase
MTETITHIALERIGAEEDGVFHTLPGVAINADERNCLNIETSFLPGAIATNDVVEIISPRRFRWLGRWDNVINSGGIKVNPEILEDKLVAIFSRLNIQRRYFIASLPDPNLGERIVLFVEGKPLPNGVKDRISEEMLNNFLKFEIPRQIIVLERFSYTATGKINRLETLKQL